jgi:dipeptidyl aminopeptidase/acylaminoacyl peptidase
MKYFIGFFLFITLPVAAQQKILDNTVYNDWKRVSDVTLSKDGKYTAYTIKPHRGDGYLYIVNNATGKTDSIFKGINPVFSGQDNYLAFKITPGFDTLRTSELKKIRKEKWPKDTLGIFLLANDSLVRIPKVKSFGISKENSWMYYIIDGNVLKDTKPKKKCIFRKKSKPEKEYTSDGNVAVFVNPADKFAEKRVKDVTEVEMPEKGTNVAYITHQKFDKADSFSLQVLQLGAFTNWSPAEKFTEISGLSYNELNTELVFTASVDTISKGKSFQLLHANFSQQSLRKLVDTVHISLPADLRVSENRTPYFSRNGAMIYFGIADKPLPEVKDTLLDNEKAKLDVWSWTDDRLQPQQLVEQSRDERKTWLCAYNLQEANFTILGNDTLSIYVLDHGNAPFALATSVKAYEKTYNWDFPNKSDYYRVDVKTGTAQLLKRGAIHDVSLSPSGRYLIFFNERDLQQYLLDINSGQETCLTCSARETWLEDVNGMPYTPGPLSTGGWMRGENEILLRSKYDLWSFNIAANQLTSLTEGNGKKQNIQFQLHEWTGDSTYIDFNNTYITGLHKDKSMSLHETKWKDGQLELVLQYVSAHKFLGIQKAEQSDQYAFQASSVTDYPDVRISTWKMSKAPKRISFANPQQSDYNWATVELVSWKSYSGVPLEGLLYKPADYDSTKKYPLLVYFYELYSDDLHNHYAPKPTASIIFPTEYASAGYFVFIPDVRYQAGHPARGAYDCILSGTDHVLKLYSAVDSTRMGLQGQSWGGYQTAQLVTMTTRYKAAMAGAPVGNMFSAYGGIRWGSGLNRQFQYERTQSRIGQTIWEAPELYVENSPIFGLPKVTTPLLIMHNDGDGAVPWYQGIELFTGLKRLGKPVWMLNYNGDDHNLMKNANRIDLSIRMRQFFDYYLMDKPAPLWLKEGVPAVNKGKNYGLGQ